MRPNIFQILRELYFGESLPEQENLNHLNKLKSQLPSNFWEASPTYHSCKVQKMNNPFIIYFSQTKHQDTTFENFSEFLDKQPTIPFPVQPQKYHIWKFQWNPMSSILWATNFKPMFIMSNQNITTPEQPLKCHNCKSQRDKQSTIPFPEQPQRYHIWNFCELPWVLPLWTTNVELVLIMNNQNIVTQKDEQLCLFLCEQPPIFSLKFFSKLEMC